MSESTTADGVRVSGQPHQHPAVRRLARACIALVRWQRTQMVSAPVLAPEVTTSRVQGHEVGHD